jgi:ketosteroid isomerase-like protein
MDRQYANNDVEDAAVRVVIERWAAAVRQKDMRGVLQNHSTDFVMFDVPPPFQSTGLDAYRKSWDLFFSWSADPMVFEIDDISIMAGSDVAFAVAAMHCGGGPAAADGDRTLAFRLTVGLRKIDGQWTIVHEHHSVPATD